MSLKFAELYGDVDLHDQQFHSKLGGIHSALGKTGSIMGNTLGTIAHGGLLLAGGLVAAGAGIGALGLKAVQASAQMEQSRIAFTTMLGSAQKADVFIRQLQHFAATTPFEFVGLQDNAKRLMAMGFAAKDVIPVLTNVGDAVAALGSGQQGIDLITYALGQMKTAGKVHTQDMMQMTNAGVAAWDMLAKHLHVGVQEAQAMVQKGVVTSDQGIAAIMEGMHSRYGGLMQKQSQTLAGIWSNIQDTVGQTLAVIGDKIVQTFDLKGKLQGLLGGLDIVKQVVSGQISLWDGLSKAVGGALSAGQFEAIGGAIGGYFSALGSFYQAIVAGIGLIAQGIQAVMPAIQTFASVMGDMLGPALQNIAAHSYEIGVVLKVVGIALLLVIAAVVLVVVVFVNLISTMMSVAGVIGDLLGAVFGFVTGGIAAFGAFWAAVGVGIHLLMSLFGSLQSTVGSVFGAIGGIIASVAGAIIGWFSRVTVNGQSMGSLVGGAAHAMASAIGGAIGAATGFIGNLLGGFTKMISGAQSGASGVTGAFQGMVNAVGGVLGRLVGLAGDIGGRIGGAIAAAIRSIHIPLPHISLSGSHRGGIGPIEFDVPDFNVWWGARGGLLRDATLIGAGERGTEILSPVPMLRSLLREESGRSASVTSAPVFNLYGLPEELVRQIDARQEAHNRVLVQKIRARGG